MPSIFGTTIRIVDLQSAPQDRTTERGALIHKDRILAYTARYFADALGPADDPDLNLSTLASTSDMGPTTRIRSGALNVDHPKAFVVRNGHIIWYNSIFPSQLRFVPRLYYYRQVLLDHFIGFGLDCFFMLAIDVAVNFNKGCIWIVLGFELYDIWD